MTDTRPDNLRLRLPRGLSAHLHQMADAEGIPLNTLVTVLLTKASRWDPAPEPVADELAEGVRDWSTETRRPHEEKLR